MKKASIIQPKKNSLTLLTAALVFAACFLLSSCTEKVEGLDPKPNIVLIMVDDMGFSDLGCYGSEINTPNLDELAMKGIRFNQFHNTSKCFPSRASLLTGMYAQKCGMSITNDSIRNAVTIGEILQEAGYRTLMVGKHHGLENMYYRGFDRYFGLRDGMCNYFNPGDQRPGELQPARKSF
ncbi:MAG: sulfatase-like hydrolase/transferase, partial [Bacteroidota bacterium]